MSLARSSDNVHPLVALDIPFLRIIYDFHLSTLFQTPFYHFNGHANHVLVLSSIIITTDSFHLHLTVSFTGPRWQSIPVLNPSLSDRRYRTPIAP